MMEVAQECVNVINSNISDCRENKLLGFAIGVHNFGEEMMHGKNDEWMFLDRIDYRYSVDKSFLVITCALHRAFSGWTVVGVNACNRMRFEKKCSDSREGSWILALMYLLRKVTPDSILVDDWRLNENIVTISIPICMLSKYREIGVMF